MAKCSNKKRGTWRPPVVVTKKEKQVKKRLAFLFGGVVINITEHLKTRTSISNREIGI